MNALLMVLFFTTQPADLGIANVNVGEDKLVCYAYCERDMCSGSCFPAQLEVNRYE